MALFTNFGKKVNSDDDSAMKEYLSFCNHAPDFEDFSILLINRDHLPLSKNKQSLPLELFDS